MRINSLIIPLYWLSFLLLLLFPSLPLLFFAPYLVLSCYKYDIIYALWRTLSTALLIELFSSSHAFGVTLLSYSIATSLLFLHVRHFFPDKWSTLPLMTYLFSLYSSLSYLFLMPFFGHPFALSLRVFLTEVLIAPLSDTLLSGIVVLIAIPLQKRKEADS